jgi:hypothetical protein
VERTESEQRYGAIGSDQVNLLISLLIRFPHISAVHYEPDDRSLRFVYLLRQVQLDELHQFVQRAQLHLEAFHSFDSARPIPQLAAIQHEHTDELLVLQIKRDVDSLSYEELNLINELVQSSFPERVVCDMVENLDEEYLDEDDSIVSFLAAGDRFGNEKLSGFREKGKVLVFSTPVRS